jgi:NADPH:quinone reductase-like Zn-dependent oxidoreductase
VKELTDGRGADVILDIVGGDYLARNVDALAVDGRLVQVGLMRGAKTQINLGPVLQKRATLTGSLLRPRTPAEKGRIARALEEHVWPLLESGTARPVIHATFRLEDAADAHRVLESGTHIGKIVLTVDRATR